MEFTQIPYRYVKLSRVVFKPGHFYQFKYLNFENDPEPLIYYLNFRNATNVKTGKIHKYIQGINFHYIPMSKRVKFVTDWLNFTQKHNSIISSNFLMLWKELIRRYPFLEGSYRRYLVEPVGIIKNVEDIKTDLVIPMVKGSIERDFSFRDKFLFYKKYKEFNKSVDYKTNVKYNSTIKKI